MHIRWQSVLMVLLVTVMAVTLGLQRQANRELQGEIELHRGQEKELARLRAEWTRLTQGQLQVGELKNLRTDHVAVMRLRGEIDAMRARVQEAEVRREIGVPQAARLLRIPSRIEAPRNTRNTRKKYGTSEGWPQKSASFRGFESKFPRAYKRSQISFAAPETCAFLRLKILAVWDQGIFFVCFVVPKSGCAWREGPVSLVPAATKFRDKFPLAGNRPCGGTRGIHRHPL